MLEIPVLIYRQSHVNFFCSLSTCSYFLHFDDIIEKKMFFTLIFVKIKDKKIVKLIKIIIKNVISPSFCRLILYPTSEVRCIELSSRNSKPDPLFLFVTYSKWQTLHELTDISDCKNDHNDELNSQIQ